MTVTDKLPARVCVQTLFNLLMEAETNDLLTYDHLSASINLDVRTEAKGRLDMARAKALKAGRVFVAVRGAGLRLSSHEDTATLESKRDIAKTHNAAKRAVEKQLTVDLKTVSADAARQSLLTQSVMGAVAVHTSAASTKLIEERLEKKQSQLTPAEVGLALFQK